ncbi:hypothetical protein [Nesterenkonia suensis]
MDKRKSRFWPWGFVLTYVVAAVGNLAASMALLFSASTRSEGQDGVSGIPGFVEIHHEADGLFWDLHMVGVPAHLLLTPLVLTLAVWGLLVIVSRRRQVSQ